MRIIRMSGLTAAPWKNGGGVTREIAAGRRGGALLWRLSMADVASDGPFSNFAGLTRILTVIEGNGIELVSAAGTLYADYGQPVRFDGGLKIEGKLVDGPLRDFNLIYDPLSCDGKVLAVAGPHRQALRANPGLILAVFCLHGDVALDGSAHLHASDTAIVESGTVQLDLAKGALALLATLALPAHAEASRSATASR